MVSVGLFRVLGKKAIGSSDVPNWATLMELSIAETELKVEGIQVLKKTTLSHGHVGDRQEAKITLEGSPDIGERILKCKLYLLHNFAQDWQ